MERKRFGRQIKFEAMKLVRERGASAAQVVRDLDIHTNLLRNLGEGVCGRPAVCVSWPGPDEARAARDRTAVARGDGAQSGRGHPKKPRPTSQRTRYEVRVHCEAP